MIRADNAEHLDQLYNQFKGSEEQVKAADDLFSSQDMVKLIRVYTEENLPPDIKNEDFIRKNWAVLGKAPVLTFLGEDDEETFDSLFRISKLQFMMSTPGYTYSFDKAMSMNQLRIYWKSTVKRAIGSTKDKVNERSMQNTQITQLTRSNVEGMMQQPKRGFFGKLKGMF